jgi:hypothetical protein
LRKLYDFNKEFHVQRLGEVQRVRDDENEWGGGRLRIMLQCIYSIAFLCLLRFDEVLKIQAHHLEVIDEIRGEIKLTLPFRKTHKFGGNTHYIAALLTCIEIKPFHLFPDVASPHLDAVRAILRWMHVSRIAEGYIFRKISVDDRISMANKPLVQRVENAQVFFANTATF